MRLIIILCGGESPEEGSAQQSWSCHTQGSVSVSSPYYLYIVRHMPAWSTWDNDDDEGTVIDLACRLVRSTLSTVWMGKRCARRINWRSTGRTLHGGGCKINRRYACSEAHMLAQVHQLRPQIHTSYFGYLATACLPPFTNSGRMMSELQFIAFNLRHNKLIITWSVCVGARECRLSAAPRRTTAFLFSYCFATTAYWRTKNNFNERIDFGVGR